MNDLITGGAGFIGRHLADALLACGQRVTALDDLSAGVAKICARRWLAIAAIEELIGWRPRHSLVDVIRQTLI